MPPVSKSTGFRAGGFCHPVSADANRYTLLWRPFCTQDSGFLRFASRTVSPAAAKVPAQVANELWGYRMRQETETSTEGRHVATTRMTEGAIAVHGSENCPVGGRYATGLRDDAARDISTALTMLLADVFAVFVKTKNFQWHMSGPNFRENFLLLDEQSKEILAMTDALAARVRKIGGTTLRSISHIGRLQRLLDNDSQYESPREMFAELRDDNAQLAGGIRSAHSLCSEFGDIATANLLKSLIDQTEGRIWFLFEVSSV
jgi:starvation-inducible DNA-binding protein